MYSKNKVHLFQISCPAKTDCAFVARGKVRNTTALKDIGKIKRRREHVPLDEGNHNHTLYLGPTTIAPVNWRFHQVGVPAMTADKLQTLLCRARASQAHAGTFIKCK